MNYSKKTIASSFIIKFIEQISVKLTSLVVSVVLARILDVNDFGTVALLTIFIHLSTAVIEGGLSTSLVQKEEIDDCDYSTVFYVSVFLSIIIYFVLFIMAPIIENSFAIDNLVVYIRVISLVIFVTPFNSVQLGYIYRNMLFKRLIIASFIGCLISGGVGIYLALNGFGIWALIWQTLLNGSVTVLILFFIVPWKPKFLFSWKCFCSHFKYGWKLLVASLIETAYTEFQPLLLGKKYSEDSLSYYNRGDTYPKYIMQSLNSAVQTVMLPVLSSKQNDLEKLKISLRKSIKMCAFFLFPAMAGFAAVSDEFVRIVLTEKWLPCVPYLQLACIIYVFQPINSSSLQAIKAIGKSDVFLIVTIIKKIIGFALLFFSLLYFNTPIAIAITSAVYAPIQLLINIYPNKKYIGYSFKEQIVDIMPSLLLSLVMFCIVFMMNYINLNIWLLLFIQIFTGVIVYFSLAYLFRFKIIVDFMSKIRRKKNE